MAGFIENFKQALNEDIPGEHYQVAGSRVTCHYCGNDTFEKSRVQLNTAGITFLDASWNEKWAYVLKCPDCGHLEWFLTEPDSI